MKFIIYSFLTVSYFFVLGFAQEAQEAQEEIPDGIVMETYKSRQTGSVDFNIYLRYPSSGKDDIKGVLAICKHSDRGLATDLAGFTRHFGYLLKFADRHQLATIGFAPPGRGWDRTANSDMLSRGNAVDQDKKLDGLARDLSRSLDRFAGKYKLPKSDWLLYGLCGGAQYAHRMAMRQPQYFKAVHVHYGGSYDVPTPKAKSIKWLVTSHADEPAYIAAQRFYRQCRAMDYQMILKGYTRSNAPEEYDPDMAYTGVTGLQKLSTDFFEYAITNKGKVDASQSYIADYVNGVVVPMAEGQWIPKSQAVILPTRKLAEAWGSISE